MRKQFLVTLLLVLGLNSGLRADFESPSTGPDLGAMMGGDRAWAFSLRTFVGYNDNVQLVPDAAVFAADQSSGYFGLTAQGSYRFLDEGSWSAGAVLRIDQTYHFESSGGAASPNNFDLTVVQPTFYLNYKADNWYGRATYSYRWEDTDSPTVGARSHEIGLMAGKKLNSSLRGEISWTHGWDDFRKSGVGINERDGERDRYSLSLIRPATAGLPHMELRYSYLDNDADGGNFRYHGHELMFRVHVPLTENLGLAAQVSYAELDYRSGVRNEQEIFKAGVQLVYLIDQNWSVDVYYNYLDIDSNARFFRGDRNDMGIGLRYDF